MSRARSVGTASRLGIAGTVALTAGLAVTLVVAINWLAARPGVRQRFDLTRTGEATLDAALLRVIEQVPGEVTIDVFFRPEPAPLERLAAQVQKRTAQLLQLMVLEVGDRVDVVMHDLADPERTSAIQERLRELRIQGLENCLVVSSRFADEQGEVLAREVVPLRGGLATFRIGNPDPNNYEPPGLASFDAERSLAQAILKVTRGRRKRAYFTQGHGEGDIFEMDGDPSGFGELETLLREDGFAIETWNGVEDGALPADCDLLAILEPRRPLLESEQEQVEDYLARGGRLVVAAAPDPADLEASDLDRLLDRWLGVQVHPGIVSAPWVDRSGMAQAGTGRVQTFGLSVAEMRSHPIVEPYRASQLPVMVSRVHPLRVARQPKHGATQSVLVSPSRGPGSWVDDPPFDFYPQDQTIEDHSTRDLVVAVLDRIPDPPAGVPEGTEPEMRAVVLGSAAFLEDAFLSNADMRRLNADLARNLFNWAVGREYRVNVRPRDPALILATPEQSLVAVYVGLYLLPGLCLVLGGVTALRRRSRRLPS